MELELEVHLGRIIMDQIIQGRMRGGPLCLYDTFNFQKLSHHYQSINVRVILEHYIYKIKKIICFNIKN